MMKKAIGMTLICLVLCLNGPSLAEAYLGDDKILYDLCLGYAYYYTDIQDDKEFQEYYPITKNIENVIDFVSKMHSQKVIKLKKKYPEFTFEDKPNFIIFPESDYATKTNTRDAPYVLEWNESKRAYDKKYTVKTGKSYYVLFDDQRLDAKILRYKDEENEKAGYDEKRVLELRPGLNGSMIFQWNGDALTNFKADKNILYMKKSEHVDGKEKLLYQRVNIPIFHVPEKRVFYKQWPGEVSEEKLMFVNFEIGGSARTLPDPETGHFNSGSLRDPQNGVAAAWCIPVEGYGLDDCRCLSRVRVAIGNGFENYPEIGEKSCDCAKNLFNTRKASGQ